MKKYFSASIILTILCITIFYTYNKKQNDRIKPEYTFFGQISGRVYDYKVTKDSERAEVGGAPVDIKITKVYPGVEVRAYEIIPEEMKTGGQHFRNHGDIGLKTFTDNEGKFTFKIPLKSEGEHDGRYIQVYLPKNPFPSEQGILTDTMVYIIAHPTWVQNSAEFRNEVY